MAGSKRKGIRLVIERLLIPELVARGFEPVSPVSDSTLEPFGRFRRRTDRGLEIVVIKFDKNRTSRFLFHVALVKSETTVWGKPKPHEDQWPTDVEPNFWVWGRGLVFRHWFGVKKVAREGITDAEYDDAVRLAIARLPDIERYFERDTRTLAMEKFPQGIADDLAYWAVCIVAVLGVGSAGLWALGWIVRRLFG